MPGISDILTELRAEHRLRHIPKQPSGKFLDLSSNDYLGLAQRHTEFREEFDERFSDAPYSSSASRLLSMQQKHHLMLEAFLAKLYGKETLLFNSGYHANVGCIGALALPSTLFVCDKLIHASIVDGLRINGAEFKRFPHNDTEKLKRILEKESSHYTHIIVVVESIYSMDGDEAPLSKLVALKKEHPGVLLYVDEAHAFGVRGKQGLGLCEEYNLIKETDILIGTFGKAAASIGAFAVVTEEMKKFFINTARPFIFSTALPPVNVAWSLLMMEKIIGMEAERRHLAEISRYFSERISEISGQSTGSDSQIIPYLTGNAQRALEIADQLRQAGYLALPIRRPTVPPGGERIRFSLSGVMSRHELDEVADLLQKIN